MQIVSHTVAVGCIHLFCNIICSITVIYMTVLTQSSF